MKKNTKILKETIPSAEEEVFNFSEICESVAETIVKNDPPFVYGIIGRWGSGKSTFLNFLIDYLPNPSQKGVVVYFNAWKSSLHKNILFAFVFDIFMQLNANKTIKLSKLNRYLLAKSTRTLMKETSKLLSSQISITKPLTETFSKSAGFFNKQMIDAMKNEIASRKSFEKICEILKDYTVYVIIDELDRCSPTHVVEIIEAIRMIFMNEDQLEAKIYQHNSGKSMSKHQIPFKYILSYDEFFIASAFKKYYNLGHLDEAFQYLTKFINFKFHIPRKEFTQFIRNIINDYGINPNYFPEGSDKDINNLLSAVNITHPRTVKRLVSYIIEWQKRLYAESENNERLNFYKRISKMLGTKENEFQLAIRLLNCYLLLIAVTKEKFPVQFEFILQKGIFQYFPYINPNTQGNQILKILYQEGNINKSLAENINYQSASWEKIYNQKGEIELAYFSSILWAGLLEINKSIYIKSVEENTHNSGKILYHRGAIPKLVSQLLEDAFSN